MISSIREDLHSKLPVVQKKKSYLGYVLMYLEVQKTCDVVFSAVSPEVKNYKAGKNIYSRLKAHNSRSH